MSTPELSTRSRTAQVKYHGLHVASIPAWACESIADEPLFDDHRRLPGTRALTWRAYLDPQRRDRRRRIRFPAGLVDRAVAALKRQGYTVRGGGQHDPFFSGYWCKDEKGGWPEYFRRACGRPRSLLVLPKIKDRVRFISEFCELQPDAHLIVVVKNNAEAKQVAGMLNEATCRTATWRPDQPRGYPWLLVKSAHSMTWCNPMPGGEFILYWDAELALSKGAAEFLLAAWESAFIGFLSRNEHHLHEQERAVLEGLFGRVVYHPGDDLPGSELLIAWLRSTTSPKALPSGNIVEQKRRRIWKNETRNRLIARAARALSDNNPTALALLGLSTAAERLNRVNCIQRPSVLVIVENEEHGRELARLLPDWRLETEGYMLPAGTHAEHDREILTLSRAAETAIGTDIVIYAAGGAEWWLEDVSFVFCWDTCATLIVDIADHGNSQAIAGTEARAAGYRRLGCVEVPTNPSPTSREGIERRCL